MSTQSLFTFILLASDILKVNSQIDIEGSVHCNETIKNYIWRGRGSEYWQLITNGIYDIEFQDCDSNLDVVVSMYDIHSHEDIVPTYCNNSDNCGHCQDTTNYPEHFTIPSLPPGTYIIQIKPFVMFRYGSYTFTIHCYPTNNDTFVLNPITTIPPASIQYNELKCGSINPIIKGELLSQSHIYYYHFTFTRSTAQMIFDSCNSSYHTHFYLWTSQFYNGASSKAGDCGIHEQLSVDSLRAGDYILGISGDGTDRVFQFLLGTIASILPILYQSITTNQ
eukprot:836247_1